MEILKVKELEKMSNNSRVNGIVLVQSYEVLPTKNGTGEYIAGQLACGGSIPFKIWSNSPVYKTFKDVDYTNKICAITGEINIWSNMSSIIIDGVKVLSGDENIFKISDFLDSKYDVDKYDKIMEDILKKNVSENAYKVYNLIMTPERKELFKNEFAAINFHDNCKGGVLAHTTKLLKVSSVVTLYPKILDRIGKDLLFVSEALHDIGKIAEYCNGTISHTGMMLSHRTIATMWITEKQKEIIDLVGEEFFYNLIAVIEQHHGEYEETPRTVVAYIVHLFDNLESQLALIEQQLERSSTSQIVINGNKLL